jgi:hypothetical protein
MPQFEPLSAREQQWLTEQLQLAAIFAGSPDGEDLPSLQSLDKAWADFIATGSAANERANGVVLCTGVAFGEHVVRKLGFVWCIATDDWGTDIAVLARPGRGDITIFPTDYVSKRWEQKETEFFAASIKPRRVHQTDRDYITRQRSRLGSRQSISVSNFANLSGCFLGSGTAAKGRGLPFAQLRDVGRLTGGQRTKVMRHYFGICRKHRQPQNRTDFLGAKQSRWGP